MKRNLGLLALAAVALGPSVASGQQNEEPGWRLVPRVGSYWIDRHDGVLFRNGTRAIEQGLVMGVTVDFDTPISWLGFRLSADRTIDARLSTGSDATTRGLSMEVRVQPVPKSWPVRPFAVFGSGLVLLDHGGEEGLESDSQGYAAYHYGGGFDVDLAGVPLRLEGFHRRYNMDRGLLSPVESPRQLSIHNAHAVFTVGVRIVPR